MNVFKRVGLLSAVFGLSALASVAQADVFSYNWNGVYDGAVSAYAEENGNGGRFRATLTDVTTGQLVAYGSYCNELGQFISAGAVTPIEVLSLTNLAAGDLTKGTVGGPHDLALFTAGQAHLGALAWVVAQHFNEAQGTTAAGVSDKEISLQLAIWHLWGLGDPTNTSFNTSYPLNAYLTNTQAQTWVNDALANHSTYVNNDVVWVRLATTGAFQDQIMYLTPEASSLALLLPGLIPIGIIIRRRSRKS